MVADPLVHGVEAGLSSLSSCTWPGSGGLAYAICWPVLVLVFRGDHGVRIRLHASPPGRIFAPTASFHCSYQKEEAMTTYVMLAIGPSKAS